MATLHKHALVKVSRVHRFSVYSLNEAFILHFLMHSLLMHSFSSPVRQSSEYTSDSQQVCPLSPCSINSEHSRVRPYVKSHHREAHLHPSEQVINTSVTGEDAGWTSSQYAAAAHNIFLSGHARTGDVVDALLSLLHARDIVLEAGHVIATLCGLEAQELRQLGAVLGFRFKGKETSVGHRQLVTSFLGIGILKQEHGCVLGATGGSKFYR